MSLSKVQSSIHAAKEINRYYYFALANTFGLYFVHKTNHSGV